MMTFIATVNSCCHWLRWIRVHSEQSEPDGSSVRIVKLQKFLFDIPRKLQVRNEFHRPTGSWERINKRYCSFFCIFNAVGSAPHFPYLYSVFTKPQPTTSIELPKSAQVTLFGISGAESSLQSMGNAEHANGSTDQKQPLYWFELTSVFCFGDAFHQFW